MNSSVKRKVILFKFFRPLGIAGNEHWHIVDECNTGIKRALGVKPRGLFGPDRQIIKKE